MLPASTALSLRGYFVVRLGQNKIFSLSLNQGNLDILLVLIGEGVESLDICQRYPENDFSLPP
jgi:hypothetical protein